jgi:exonuclease III
MVDFINDVAMLNLNLDKIKSILNYRSMNPNSVYKHPFLSMLWNINTINQRKLNKVNDIIHSLGTKDNDDRAQSSIQILDLIIIIEVGKISSKFNLFNLNGYKLFTQLRTDRKGGGIAFYVKKELNASIKFTELTVDFELMHMEITKKDDMPRNIVGIYRPPSGNKEAFYQAFESLLLRNDSNIIIMGDINLSRPDENDVSKFSRDYSSLLCNFNLTVANNAITRYNKITHNHTIIDHVIVDKDRCDVLTLTTDNKITDGFSDHNIIFIKEFGSDAQISPSTSMKIKIINKKKVIESIKTDIKNLPFNIHPQIMCESIVNFITTLIDTNTVFITLKNVNPNVELPGWIDNTYINYSNRINNLTEHIHNLKSTGKPTSKLERRLHELINDKDSYSSLKSKAYYNDKAVLNTKESWKVLNHLSGRKREKNSISLLDNGLTISDDLVVANLFQDYFLSIVGETEPIPNHHVTLGERISQSFEFEVVTTSEILNILKTLDIGKATGRDGISPFILSQTSDDIVKHVEVLLNQMISYGIYPSKLKETIIHPIHKKESRLIKENYRPVSVTTSLDKVIEEAILRQLNEFLIQHNILDQFQFGFKKGRSCEDLLAKVISTISNILDNKRIAIIISLDLSKAFDMVNHEILLAKLEHYGIRNKSYDLLKDFLTNRVQFVKINEAISYLGHIRKGIPQGTQKGPTLFSIYVNDMKELMTNSKIFKFADDTMLIFDIDPISMAEATEHIREDLSLLSKYYVDNKLMLNLNKSQSIIFGNDSQNIQKTLNDHQINTVESIKYLGIIIDDQLNFQPALTTLRKSLNQAIGAIYVIKQSLTIKPLMDFYFGHFQSHISYCNFFLIRLPSKDIADLQILQNRILKMIHQLPSRTHTRDVYEKYAKNVLPVMGIIFKSLCVMVKKSLIEQDIALIHVEPLRSNRVNLLKSKRHKTKFMANDVEVLGPQIYNSLPEELRLIRSLNLFKTKLRSFLMSKSGSLASIQQLYTKNKII